MFFSKKLTLSIVLIQFWAVLFVYKQVKTLNFFFVSTLIPQLHTVSMTLCWVLYCSVACCWYLIHYKNLCSRYKYCCCTPWGSYKKTKGYWNGEEKKKKSRMIQFLRRFFKSRERNSEEGRDKFCFVSSVLQKMCPYWLLAGL